MHLLACYQIILKTVGQRKMVKAYSWWHWLSPLQSNGHKNNWAKGEWQHKATYSFYYLWISQLIEVEADGYTMHVDKQYVTKCASSAPSLPNIVITRDMWEGQETTTSSHWRQATSPLRFYYAPLSPLKFVCGQFLLISTLCLLSTIINYVLTILVFS